MRKLGLPASLRLNKSAWISNEMDQPGFNIIAKKKRSRPVQRLRGIDENQTAETPGCKIECVPRHDVGNAMKHGAFGKPVSLAHGASKMAWPRKGPAVFAETLRPAVAPEHGAKPGRARARCTQHKNDRDLVSVGHSTIFTMTQRQAGLSEAFFQAIKRSVRIGIYLRAKTWNLSAAPQAAAILAGVKSNSARPCLFIICFTSSCPIHPRSCRT